MDSLSPNPKSRSPQRTPRRERKPRPSSWEPGTVSGYHALTYDHLIGEVSRRITGQRLGDFFAAHIAGPLGVDLHIGLPPSEFDRVANVVPPPSFDSPQLEPNSVACKTWTNPTMPLECSWTERWRRTDIGAANGHGNARSLAHLQSAVVCGGLVEMASGSSRRRRATGSSKCKATGSTS